MSEQKKPTFSRTAYRQKRAAARADETGQPVEVPLADEGDETITMYLRRVSPAAFALSAAMPAELTNAAYQGMQAADLIPAAEQHEQNAIEQEQAARKAAAEGDRSMKLIGRVLQEGMCCPRLVANANADDEIEPADLCDRAVFFIFRYCTGQAATQTVATGVGEVTVNDLERFRKQPARRARASVTESQLQQVAG